jgi:hypothetical protein
VADPVDWSKGGFRIRIDFVQDSAAAQRTVLLSRLNSINPVNETRVRQALAQAKRDGALPMNDGLYTLTISRT